MKRYLTGYSKNTLTIRDRKTGLYKKYNHIQSDEAELIQDCIKSTNYYLNTRKNGKVQVKSINDLPLNLSENKPKWGDMLPENITWEREIIEQREKELIKRLNDILSNESED